MFGDSTNNFATLPADPQERHPQFNKSRNMQEVLYGPPEVNNKYFIDSLERFKKDFASQHREDRDVLRDKYNSIVAKKQQELQQQKMRYETENEEYNMKQTLQQSNQQQAWDMGLRKNGMTTGIPVNPVTHEYASNYRGQQFQRQQSEKKLNNMLRLHHLQTKGTCGYNLINGKQNFSVKNLLPEHLLQGMDSRIKEYREHYTLRASQRQ